MTLIYMIRHGQASAGQKDYDKLSPLGRRQSGVLGRHLASAGVRPDIVFTGTMRRQRDTAALCMEQLAMYPEIVALPGLDEMDLFQLVRARLPHLTDRVAMEAEAPGPEGFANLVRDTFADWMAAQPGVPFYESFAAFQARTRGALDEAMRRCAELGAERAMIFTSAGPIASVAQAALGVDDPSFPRLAMRIVNASITRLLREEGGDGGQNASLLSFNDFSAMEADKELVTFR